jgi:alanine-glyoxylate transaminase/serine-glyoxylate transaminase/serine-pyruvate transaminase
MAEAVRRCVHHWGLEIWCDQPADYSSSLTAVRVPENVSADALRAHILVRSSLSLGNGLGKLADRVFRIGHLGDFNDASMLGTLAAIESGLLSFGLTANSSGVSAATSFLAQPQPHAAAAE